MSGIVLCCGFERGLRLLERLIARGTPPVLVLAAEEHAHERARCQDRILQTARAAGIPALGRSRIGDPESLAAIEAAAGSLLVVAGWRTLIPDAVLAAHAAGAVAVHDSLLPRYRGFAPTAWALINGEPETGVTLFHMSSEVDAGDIVGQLAIPIGPRCDAAEPTAAVVDATVAVVDAHIDGLLAGTAPRHAQDHSQATYGAPRTPADGQIDWSAGTEAIDRLIRALAPPLPGAFTTLAGGPLTILRAAPVTPAPAYAGRVPGRPVRIGDDGVDVLTGDGLLRIELAAVEDGPVQPARELIASLRLTLGRR